MKVYFGTTGWDGCIFTFNISFRKKNYDYLLEFETSRHYLTIHLFSAWSESRGITRFIDRMFGRIESGKYKKNRKYLNKKK